MYKVLAQQPQELEEAAAYSGIGINKLREYANQPGCTNMAKACSFTEIRLPGKKKDQKLG